jgi:gluconolactonase
MTRLTLSLSAFLLLGCAEAQVTPIAADEQASIKTPPAAMPSVGGVTPTRPDLISPTMPVENLGGEFMWSEGPVWISQMNALLFTDVPGNKIWKYTERGGISEWMSPAGAVPPVPDHISSAGANGLLQLDAEHILVPDHGNRTLYKMNLETREKTVLADRFDGKRLNSPNDVALHSSGLIFFTDPPYGLKGQDDSPEKELAFNGVYALSPDGSMVVVDDSLPRPNGVILSPDERTLYVSNSTSANAFYMAYDVSPDGAVSNGRKILDVTADIEGGEVGNPDGFAMAKDGTLFATGPGGVLILSPTGERLGLIRTGARIANVTFGGTDGRDLYMTSHTFLARVRTKVQGHGY